MAMKHLANIEKSRKEYHELLKYKLGNNNPRGYPDAYFDAQTWDFKTSTYNNVETIRQLINLEKEKRQIKLCPSW